MFPDNLTPVTAVTDSLTSSTPVANVALSHFWPYGVLIAGVFLGIGTLLALIAIFGWIYAEVTGGSQYWYFSKRERDYARSKGWDQHYKGLIFPTKKNIYFSKRERDYAIRKGLDDND